jgi:hypothetical protein
MRSLSGIEAGDVGSSVPKSGCWLEWYFSSPRVWSSVREKGIKPPSQIIHQRRTLRAPELDRWWTSKLDYWPGMYALSPHIMLVTVLSGQCWQWYDVTSRSCRWGCCRVDVHSSVMSPLSRAGDDAPKSCYDGAAMLTLAVVWCCYRVMPMMALLSHRCEGTTELSIVRSPDLHMVVCVLNDSSSWPMIRTCCIQKITPTCLSH